MKNKKKKRTRTLEQRKDHERTAKALALDKNSDKYKDHIGCVLGRELEDFTIKRFWGIVDNEYAFEAECRTCGKKRVFKRAIINSKIKTIILYRRCKVCKHYTKPRSIAVKDVISEEALSLFKGLPITERQADHLYMVLDEDGFCSCGYWNEEGKYEVMFQHKAFDMDKAKRIYETLEVVRKYPSVHHIIDMGQVMQRTIDEQSVSIANLSNNKRAKLPMGTLYMMFLKDLAERNNLLQSVFNFCCIKSEFDDNHNVTITLDKKNNAIMVATLENNFGEVILSFQSVFGTDIKLVTQYN